MPELAKNEAHPAFKQISSEYIEALSTTCIEYEHIETGAKHYHLQANNKENVFLVALKTVPTDSTGVAHILEHTALCGSEKYPVRDPFFMMLRRSINTFMNAFTSSDWTAYPFASQSRKDFDNLLSVYLDAVFFSRIDEMDFLQEGHRLEFEEIDNPESALTYKGVVFNEMKGAMSSESSVLYQTLSKYLFPTSTYHFNSGGEPEDIPDLTYAELMRFYKRHYHPSNAVFFTFGDISAYDHHTVFENNVLSKFKRSLELPKVNLEKRYLSPLAVEEAYAADGAEGDADNADKTHVTLSWLLGESADLELSLKAHLLSSVLLDNSASPLRKVLETSDLGKSPSPMCGLEDSNREMSFSCGLEGCASDSSKDVEALILNCLVEIKEKGVDQQQVEAVLHQLELSQREIGGDRYPYGLQLILSALSPSIHGACVSDVLNLDPVIEKLREEIKDEKFIPRLVDEFLLKNLHRLRLSLKPDLELSKRRIDAEAEKLEKIKLGLSESEKTEIISKSTALQQRQEMVEDESILPKVGKEDVAKSLIYPESADKALGKLSCAAFNQGTNGLYYQQVVVELPNFDDQELLNLSTFCKCFAELGVDDKDYLNVQTLQSQITGGVSASYSYKTISSDSSVHGHFVLSGKALSRNSTGLNELLHDTFKKVRFDEISRIKELLAQIRSGKEQSITGNGHALAMMLSSSGLSESAQLSNRLSGMEQIRHLKQLDDEVQSKDSSKAAEAFAEQLSNMHKKLLDQPMEILVVDEEKSLELMYPNLATLWGSEKAANFSPIELPAGFSKTGSMNQMWTCNTQVNFCSKAFSAVNVEHEDAPALTVLGGFLRNGYLHKSIREQGGAYGGGASFDAANSCFRFFSYRDPRLAETLGDFDASIEWMLQEKHQEAKLDEAILGVISDIDKPSSPAGEAKHSFYSNLYGRTPEKRRVFREKILALTLSDLLRVSETYLTSKDASVAVIGSVESKSIAQDLGLEVFAL